MTNANEMSELFARWKKTDQSLLAFGKSEGVAYAKLLYWRRKLGDDARKKPEVSTPTLVPVRVIADESEPTQSPSKFEIWFANGTSIDVPTGFDEHELRRLVGVLLAC